MSPRLRTTGLTTHHYRRDYIKYVQLLLLLLLLLLFSHNIKKVDRLLESTEDVLYVSIDNTFAEMDERIILLYLVRDSF